MWLNFLDTLDDSCTSSQVKTTYLIKSLSGSQSHLFGQLISWGSSAGYFGKSSGTKMGSNCVPSLSVYKQLSHSCRHLQTSNLKTVT